MSDITLNILHRSCGWSTWAQAPCPVWPRGRPSTPLATTMITTTTMTTLLLLTSYRVDEVFGRVDHPHHYYGDDDGKCDDEYDDDDDDDNSTEKETKISHTQTRPNHANCSRFGQTKLQGHSDRGQKYGLGSVIEFCFNFFKLYRSTHALRGKMS